MNHIWIWNGNTYEFNICESEKTRRIKHAFAIMHNSICVSDEKESSPDEIILESCKIIRHFFDYVLENGAGVKICGEKHDINAHVTAYIEFIMFCFDQIDGYRATVSAIEQKTNEWNKELEECQE